MRKFDEGIRKVLQSKGNFQCGNYVGYTDGNVTAIRMFGNKIFEFWHPTKTFTYSFCGYEGKRKTTHAINTCLAAVDAAYRVSCKTEKDESGKKSVRVIETQVNKAPSATGFRI